jgi:hypothetical protein
VFLLHHHLEELVQSFLIAEDGLRMFQDALLPESFFYEESWLYNFFTRH